MKCFDQMQRIIRAHTEAVIIFTSPWPHI